MIPKANMKVVIPNMIILGRDEMKPGLLLKVVYCKLASSFLRKHNSQEDVDRGYIDYDIGACVAGHNGLETREATARLLSLTIHDADQEVVVHCHFVLRVVYLSIKGVNFEV